MRRIKKGELPAAARTLAAAFSQDPFFVYLLDDPERRRSWTERFMRGGIGLCPLDCVFVTDDTPSGVVALYSPGSYPPRMLRSLPYMAKMLWGSVVGGLPLGRLMTIRKVSGEIEAAHPKFPCWYMLELGVLPSEKGKGLGGALTRHSLELADADGLPLYLETTNRDNLSYYEHFGFELVGTIEHIGDAPPVWRMLRKAVTTERTGGGA